MHSRSGLGRQPEAKKLIPIPLPFVPCYASVERIGVVGIHPQWIPDEFRFSINAQIILVANLHNIDKMRVAASRIDITAATCAATLLVLVQKPFFFDILVFGVVPKCGHRPEAEKQSNQ